MRPSEFRSHRHSPPIAPYSANKLCLETTGGSALALGKKSDPVFLAEGDLALGEGEKALWREREFCFCENFEALAEIRHRANARRCEELKMLRLFDQLRVEAAVMLVRRIGRKESV